MKADESGGSELHSNSSDSANDPDRWDDLSLADKTAGGAMAGSVIGRPDGGYGQNQKNTESLRRVSKMEADVDQVEDQATEKPVKRFFRGEAICGCGQPECPECRPGTNDTPDAIEDAGAVESRLAEGDDIVKIVGSVCEAKGATSASQFKALAGSLPAKIKAARESAYKKETGDKLQSDDNPQPTVRFLEGPSTAARRGAPAADPAVAGRIYIEVKSTTWFNAKTITLLLRDGKVWAPKKGSGSDPMSWRFYSAVPDPVAYVTKQCAVLAQGDSEGGLDESAIGDLQKFGPPDEWSGAVVTAAGSTRCVDMKDAWDRMSDLEKKKIRAKWSSGFDAELREMEFYKSRPGVMMNEVKHEGRALERVKSLEEAVMGEAMNDSSAVGGE